MRLVRAALNEFNTNEKRSDQLAQSIHPELASDYADSFAEHARQAAVIRDQNRRVELLRSRLKKLRQCCRDLIPVSDKIREKLGDRWSMAMRKCVRWLRADYRSTSPLVEMPVLFDDDALSCRSRPQSLIGSHTNECCGDDDNADDSISTAAAAASIDTNQLAQSQPTASSSNQEILEYLMTATEAIHRKLLGNGLEGLLVNSMQSVFDSDLTDFIKGPVRSARLQSEDFMALYSTYQDQLRQLNSLVHSITADRRRASKNPNATAFPLRAAEQKRYGRVRNELSQTEQQLEASAQLAFQHFQSVSENVETDSLPGAFIGHLKALRSFFQEGLTLCEALAPEQALVEWDGLLAERKEQFREAKRFSLPFREAPPAVRQSFSSATCKPPPSPPSTPSPVESNPTPIISCMMNIPAPPPPLLFSGENCAEKAASDSREIINSEVSGKTDAAFTADPLIKIPEPKGGFVERFSRQHAAIVRLLTDPEMSLLRCLITGGTVTFPSLPPAYLPPTAFRHINSMLRVLELSGCLSQVMTNLVSRRSCGYFNHQCGLFDLDSDALSALRVPLVESMLNPAVLAAAVLCKLNSAASMEPAGNNVIDKTDNWWLDRLVVKQFLAVYARPFLQKTVGSLVGEISAKVAAAADGQTAVDRQQIIEWTQKLLRSLTHHRGLLPRSVRELCRSVGCELPLILLQSSSLPSSSALINSVQKCSGGVWRGDDEQSVGELLLLVVLLFRNLLLPAIRSPENWGLWTAAEHGTISTQVLLSHSSPSASQPPSKRGTVIFAQSAGAAASIHAENLYRQLDAIANLLEDLSGLFIGIERQSASLDDILVVHTLYEEFERSLRDLCRWLTKSSAAATASSTNDSSGVGVASDGLEHWMIRDELNCIAEDFLVTCWEHLKSPVYPELNSAYLELTNGYLQVQITQQQVAEARLRAATASAAAPNNRRPTSRKSVLIKWQKPFLNGNSNTNSSDSD